METNFNRAIWNLEKKIYYFKFKTIGNNPECPIQNLAQ